MNTIAKKYLLRRNSKQALAMLRYYTAKLGLLPAGSILESEYRTAKDPNRYHIGAMMANVMELEDPEAARQCAMAFGVHLYPGFSVGENIMASEYLNDETILWRHIIRQTVKNITAGINSLPGIVKNTGSSTFYNISSSGKDNIFAYITYHGSLHVVCVNNTDDAILIDEEEFCGELPLYFTESDHFISPVFKLKTIGNILDFLMMETGYPSIPVKYSVVFDHQKASLCNKDEYADSADWAGISVLTAQDDRHDQYFFDDAASDDKAGPTDAYRKIRCMLASILEGLSFIYNVLAKEGKLDKTTDAELRKLARSHNLFVKQDT